MTEQDLIADLKLLPHETRDYLIDVFDDAANFMSEAIGIEGFDDRVTRDRMDAYLRIRDALTDATVGMPPKPDSTQTQSPTR